LTGPAPAYRRAARASPAPDHSLPHACQPTLLDSCSRLPSLGRGDLAARAGDRPTQLPRGQAPQGFCAATRLCRGSARTICSACWLCTAVHAQRFAETQPLVLDGQRLSRDQRFAKKLGNGEWLRRSNGCAQLSTDMHSSPRPNCLCRDFAHGAQPTAERSDKCTNVIEGMLHA
jgi:hypothetical protein